MSCTLLYYTILFYTAYFFLPSFFHPSIHPSFLSESSPIFPDAELETYFETAHSNYLQQTAQRTHDFKELTQNDQKLTGDIDKMRKKIDSLQTNVQQARTVQSVSSFALSSSIFLHFLLSTFKIIKHFASGRTVFVLDHFMSFNIQKHLFKLLTF